MCLSWTERAGEQEDQEHDRCGKLVEAMCTTRDAAQKWQRKCAESTGARMLHRKGAPRVTSTIGSRTCADESIGAPRLRAIRQAPKGHSRPHGKVKVAVTQHNDKNELRVLKRYIKRAPGGTVYESGQHRPDRLVGEVGLMPHQTVVTLAVHEPLKVRKNQHESRDVGGDLSTFGVGQPLAGRGESPRACVGQPCAGRGGSKHGDATTAVTNPTVESGRRQSTPRSSM